MRGSECRAIDGKTEHRMNVANIGVLRWTSGMAIEMITYKAVYESGLNGIQNARGRRFYTILPSKQNLSIDVVYEHKRLKCRER